MAMKNLITKTLLALLFFITLSACKKGDKDPTPSVLSRDFSLAYTNASDWTQVSFATLKEDVGSTAYNWADAKANSAIVHFGLGSFLGITSFYAPDDQAASIIFSGNVNGVVNWPVRKGLTFDSGAVNNLDFDALTKENIDSSVPDAGFGNLDGTKIQIQQGKIIRFIYRDTNNVLKYKGYMKVTAIGNGIPKTASVTVKYIAK